MDDVVFTVNVTGNVTKISGYVVNLTWLPPFDIDLGFLKCMFKPFKYPELAENKYRMECDFFWNISGEQVYVPVPMTRLKDLEEIQRTERRVPELEAWNLFLTLSLVITLVIMISYVVYNEYFVYKE